MKVIYGNKRLSVRFQDECENDLTSNQLTAVVVEKSPVTEEYEVLRISEKTNETFPLEKGYYSVCFCVV